MATIDYLKDDIIINGTATAKVVDALRQARVADTHIVDIVGNWSVGATRTPTPTAFRFTTDVQANDANCASTYGRAFAHTDWIDGESRVQAGMTPEELGFNARFHAIENEFDAVAAQLDRVGRCAQELRADLLGIVNELQSKITSMQNAIHGLQQDRDDGDRNGPAILGTIDVGGISKFVTKFGNDFKFVSMDTAPIMTDPKVYERGVFDPKVMSPDRMRVLVDEIDGVMDNPTISRLFVGGTPVTVADLRRNASNVTLPSGVTIGSLLANADATTRFESPGDAVGGIVGVIAEDLPAATVTELRRDVFEAVAVDRTGSAVLNSNVAGAVTGAAGVNDALVGAGVARVGDVSGSRPSVLVDRVVAGNAAVDSGAVRVAINNAVLAGAIRNLGQPQ